jgi:chromate transporter
MVNLATYVGGTRAGLPGALAATTAVVLPSFVIILLIMVLLKTALKNPYVQAALRGMKPAMAGIILATGVYMILRNAGIAGGAPDLAAILLTLGLGGVYYASRKVIRRGISPIALIGLAALAGILVC